ncbi:DUF3536 domain-containing protein [Aminivibrio sp.]|jgi:alpha-amylase/alpha-mannosidase (GH57 family)|uniref:DUF3536 domain-containing protein n=1 Tax=Aminivibrio sp. TaxID=1872489 RepID=UPI003D977D11
MTRSICIHSHFYQPPRENPWLEEVEIQESAAPYHDWNERVTAECYGPNTAARILDGEGWIRCIVNNYARISFNFGPTLLSWMEKKRPRFYESILSADRIGAERFSGHGPAIAQVYNHMIMPLANARDKETQVLWGLEDFRTRFRRDPEGMWLAETAADTATLEVLAENGISFTILAPRQAAAVRISGSAGWKDVSGERIDPTRPYTCVLPSGRSIALFFYNGALSREVAFGGALRNGGTFASMLRGAFPAADSPANPLVSIATDGETFGHHHKYGDMALAYCLDELEKSGEVELTIYSEFLAKHPPQDEVRIVEYSSWSCAHGVERWRNDCGCCSSFRAGWSQRWRKPLRDAFDQLRDRISPLFEKRGTEFFTDPWAVRNRYISVVLSRSAGNTAAFLEREAGRTLSPEEKTAAVSLLEMERNLMLMYTSCGWFFDELSGIETLQVMAYAARALELGERLFPGEELGKLFRSCLKKVPSNIAEFRDGERLFDFFIAPLRADLLRAGAHYAVSALFLEDEAICSADRVGFSSYRILRCSLEREDNGVKQFVTGNIRIRSEVTLREAELFVAALYREGKDVICGVSPHPLQDNGAETALRIREALRNEDEQLLVDFFGHNVFSLRHLFKDGQRNIVSLILSREVSTLTGAMRKAVHGCSQIMSILSALSMPAPDAFRKAAEVALNDDLRKALISTPLDIVSLERRVADAAVWGIPLDTASLGHEAVLRLEKFCRDIDDNPGNREILGEFHALLSFLKRKSWDVNLWDVQNLFVRILNSGYMTDSGLSELYGEVGRLLLIRPGCSSSGLSCSSELPGGEKS